MSDDPLAEYLDDGPEVRYVGGPLDGGVHLSPHATTFSSYLHDEGTRAARADFDRAHSACGYVHWCGRHVATGELLHAYVHGSAIALWLERVEHRHHR